jgi:hypothetical protein
MNFMLKAFAGGVLSLLGADAYRLTKGAVCKKLLRRKRLGILRRLILSIIK